MNEVLESTPQCFVGSSSVILRKQIPTARKKTHSQYRISHNKTLSSESMTQLIPHSKILEICSNKNLQSVSNANIELQNKRLVRIMRQMNDTLTYKVEKKGAKIYSLKSNISMRELLNQPSKDIERQIISNEAIIENLSKQLESGISRMKLVQNINYRIKIEEEIKNTAQEIKDKEQRMREMRRKHICKQKIIDKKINNSKAEEVLRLRQELTKMAQHSSQLEKMILEAADKNDKLKNMMKVLNKKEKQLSLQVNQINQLDEFNKSVELINQKNEIYILSLNKLQKQKQRYQTLNDINKVKYYNALKKLQTQVSKEHQLQDRIKQINKQINSKKEKNKQINLSISLDYQRRKNQSALVARDHKQSIILTQVPEDMRGDKYNQQHKECNPNFITVRKSAQSEKLLKEGNTADTRDK